MNTPTENRTVMVRVVALGFLLATLLVAALSSAPADAAVTSGKAFAWGDNQHGQLGNGNTGTDSNVPVAVQNLTDLKSVKAGAGYGLALKWDGTVWAWGYNGDGQLGDGSNAPSNVPVKVKNLTNVRAISAGYAHSLALKEDGSVWAWGYNGQGQLGNGTSGPGTDSNVPVRVGNLGTEAKGIAAGNNFSAALMKDGTVKSWGYNNDGQLGDGTNTPRNRPGPVSNLTGVKAIATDSSATHVLALLNSGTAKSWGYNFDGQLGVGTSGPGTNSNVPVRVKNLTGIKAVATGGYHSLALMESGRARAWGDNEYGQLGNGTSGTDRSTPGNVLGLENVRSISAGRDQSSAVLESGRARSWGDNTYGQLGNGNTGTNSDVPVAVRNLTGVMNIDGGYGFTLAVTG